MPLMLSLRMQDPTVSLPQPAVWEKKRGTTVSQKCARPSAERREIMVRGLMSAAGPESLIRVNGVLNGAEYVKQAKSGEKVSFLDYFLSSQLCVLGFGKGIPD